MRERVGSAITLMKNVVLCCDGTANEFAQDRTNIVRLFSTLVQDPILQAVSYHPGLGTMEPSGVLMPLRRRFARFLGLAFGYGLENDIRDAYVFLMGAFEPGDRLFMFGFSRGAYTVRAVAALLYLYGLIPRGNEPLVPYAIRMFGGLDSRESDDGAPDQAKQEFFKLAGSFKATFGKLRECKPHFVGLFDTVSSIGWIENPIRFPFTASNPDINIARHAIAIDERRAFFRTNLWTDPPKGGPRDLKQVWFPGVHADVGGGYPESESGLSKISLEWMLREATTAGLAVDLMKRSVILGERDKRNAKPDPNAQMHQSLIGAWWLAEVLPKKHYDWSRKELRRRMNLGRRRTIPATALVHRAAYERANGYSKSLPSTVTVID
jgi:uncharacterized protein (DUF2235 family)